MPRRGLTPGAVTAAAVAVADADGLEAVTLVRVAADLGVRPPSLYNHVAGREELLRAVTLCAVDELLHAMTESVIGRAGPAAVQALADAYRDYARAHPGRAATLLRAPAPDDTALQAAGRRLEAVMGAALRDFALADDELVHAVRQLRATVVGFVAIESAGGFKLPVDLDETFRRLIAAVVGGLTPAD